MRVEKKDTVSPDRSPPRAPGLRNKEFVSLTVSAFAELGLSERLLRALEDAQYDTPTPIQRCAIPYLLDGMDLLGIAQTGTGKTAAFTLPLLQNLVEDGVKASPWTTRALILAPTRELALQISSSIKTYGRHLQFRQAVVMGGVPQRPQIEALRCGVDILVATPGRLLDLAQQRRADLSQCEYLIIDEADRMFDMGFIRDVRKIVAMLPDERQTQLFSATMPAEVAKLAGEVLFEPERVEIAPSPGTMENVVTGRVEELIYLGDHIRARLTVAGDDGFIVKVPNAYRRVRLDAGAEVPLGWTATDCRALDAGSTGESSV